jgi:multiple sugar transport system substrate-binding protein
MPRVFGRRTFVAGVVSSVPLLLAACGQAATPTPAPAKPTEAPKPTEPAKPAAAAAPTAAPRPTQGVPGTRPAEPTKPAAPTPAAAPKPTNTPIPAIKAAAKAGATEIDVWTNWGTPPFQAAMRAVVDEFVKQHPDIAPNVVPGAGQNEKLLPAIAAGNPPDTVTLLPTSQFVVRNALLPVDDYVKGSAVVKRENYTDAQLDFLSWKGKLYGVPVIENGPWFGLAWNKNLFQEAGLDPEKPPTTLQELAAFDEKLTKVDASGNLKQIGFDPLDAMGGWYFPYVWTAIFDATWYDPGAAKLSLTAPAVVDAADYVVSYYKRVGPEKITGFRQNFGGWTSPQSAFPQGVQAMQMNGYWTPGELAKVAKPGQKFGYTWVPTMKGDKIQTPSGWAACTPRTARNPEKGFRFTEFLTTTQAGQMIFDNVGWLNGTRAMLKELDAKGSPDVKWYLESVDKAERKPPVHNIPVYNELATRLGTGLDEVARGKRDSKAMLEELQTQIQKALDDAMRA